jgi:hypothetical protein
VIWLPPESAPRWQLYPRLGLLHIAAAFTRCKSVSCTVSRGLLETKWVGVLACLRLHDPQHALLRELAGCDDISALVGSHPWASSIAPSSQA